ncbi:hypothetical protein [Microcoleus sp. D2_18a_D3]|uniref:hypothetical protein n=1 Tax=Microcoleus sp. D2_18a_D3 TaxID=3055330 RepID=UPI002FCF8E51
MQINRSKITQDILNALAFVRLKLPTLKAPKAPAPTPQYGQVPLPLPLPKLGDTTKLIVLFLVASITTALMLPRVIGGIKVSTARPAITMNLANHKTVNRIFWVLVSAAAIAAITEKDWRK